MSTIPTKEIAGDVAVGRNIRIGGKATIQGNVRLSHNLQVDGWLEANNIKSANKGLYVSLQSLEERYPKPETGWFAGVGASAAELTASGITAEAGKAYYCMYVGIGGHWERESHGGLYEVTVDLEEVATIQEDLNELEGAHEYLEGRVGTLEANLATETSARTAADAALQGNIDNESTARQNADAVLQTAIDAEASARKNLVSEIELADINLDITRISTAVLLGTDASVFKVTVDGKPVGVMQMFTDNMHHQLTQVITTNHILNGEGNGHTDTAVHTYRRQFGSASEPLSSATWSQWEEQVATTTGNNNDIAISQKAATDAIEAEAAARQQQITAEATARESADSSLSDQLEAEAATRQEETTALSGRVSTLEQSPTAVAFAGQTTGEIAIEMTGLNSLGNTLTLLWCPERMEFVARVATKYYNTWLDSYKHNPPRVGVAYINTEESAIYAWDGEQLTTVGRDLSAEISTETSEREAADEALAADITDLQTTVQTLTDTKANKADTVWLTEEEYEALTPDPDITYITYEDDNEE